VAHPFRKDIQQVTSLQMMLMKRSGLVIAVLLLIALLVPACASKKIDCTRSDIFCVGLVTEVGTITDQSFNQSALEGVEQARTDGVADWTQYIETADASEYAKNIATFADAGYDVIVTVGFNMTVPTQTAAAQYPNIYFIGVDQYQDSTMQTLSNLAGLNFPEDQAGFLAGALAAMMTQSTTIGAVCASDELAATWRYCEGYRAGAMYINAEAMVLVVYHNDVGAEQSSADPAWGASKASAMVDQGADVIFGVGGATGNGAVDEAASRGIYAIGAETDRYYTLIDAAPYLLSSVVKLVAPGVRELIEKARNAQAGQDTFPCGNFMGKIGYAPYHDLEPKIPSEVKSRLEEVYQGLLNSVIQTNVLPIKLLNP
jgi:basic membrane protein A